MWERIKRIVRSILGWFIDVGENPELILKQNIRDMQDRIPEMNEQLAMLKAQVNLTDTEMQRLKKREQELANKIKAALKAENRGIALNYATTLEEVREEIKHQDRQHQLASASFDKALKYKQHYTLTIQRKIDAAKKALNAKAQAEWHSKIADAMETFNVAGVDATHDEMVTKIEQDAAKEAAKLEIAMDNFDKIDIEEDARNIAANDTLRQFELEMGMSSDINAPPEAPEKTVGDVTKERQRV